MPRKRSLRGGWYKHKVTNKENCNLRPLKSPLINTPRVVLLWTDPPGVAYPTPPTPHLSLDFGRHCLLKKGKAWSRSEMIIRGRCGMGHAEVIPKNPALWIWGIQFQVLLHASLPISKNRNINFRWLQSKSGGYQNAGTGKQLEWGILFLKWKPWVQTPRSEGTTYFPHLQSG